jgi:hypothetical protein
MNRSVCIRFVGSNVAFSWVSSSVLVNRSLYIRFVRSDVAVSWVSSSDMHEYKCIPS